VNEAAAVVLVRRKRDDAKKSFMVIGHCLVLLRRTIATT
jgi:hypothetical protein